LYPLDTFYALYKFGVALTSKLGNGVMADLTRETRLQIMLTDDELRAVDDWRFKFRLPSRASAVRELLRKGLAVEGMTLTGAGKRSGEFGVIDAEPTAIQKKRTNGKAKTA